MEKHQLRRRSPVSTNCRSCFFHVGAKLEMTHRCIRCALMRRYQWRCVLRSLIDLELVLWLELGWVTKREARASCWYVGPVAKVAEGWSISGPKWWPEVGVLIKAIGMELDEDYIVWFIMGTLPSQFDSIRSSYNAQKEQWTIEEMTIIRAKEEDDMKKGRARSVAMVTNQNNDVQKRKPLQRIPMKTGPSRNRTRVSKGMGKERP
ncbi:Retrovirus-related Pol poly from transposon TNT 1-94 [Olea europaea subsp. europaea]|uniref:Retrovirus-related Pol poly from transposon TNT 1-94 n=1 Tax=Olea europaea subsp. europaea TaxID=158383 RepID=A0A8S0R9M7_OLEEU|nr:Retrovirus-related Pol poly from transposon TNT 1-94 [Olea europaea subsp. europaea]